MSIKNTPAFETEDQDQEVVEQATASTQTAVAPAAATATAVAKPRATLTPFLGDQEELFPADAVVGLSMATPRIKAEQGAAYSGTDSLGTKFRIQVESFNNRHLVTAGLNSNDAGYKESMEYLRTSYDGETIYGEETTVTDYIEHLKGLGFDKARVAPYIDLWGMVVWTEKSGDIPMQEQKLHLVQLSQTSAGAFRAFRITEGLKAARGVEVATDGVIEVTAEPRSKGTLKYTNFSFSVPQ